MWPVDMERAINRLQGTGKRKARPHDRPPLADLPIAIREGELNSSLGERAVRKMERAGHVITGVPEGAGACETPSDFPKCARSH